MQSISAGLDSLEISPTYTLQRRCIKAVADENQGELSDEDDDLCPVDCVREFKTDEEFLNILEKAKETNSLVVVDFYRTSCGSCKYIEQGFSKLCKGASDEDADVIFLKHNVLDEYDEQSEVAERLRIRAVPLFHFYKNGMPKQRMYLVKLFSHYPIVSCCMIDGVVCMFIFSWCLPAGDIIYSKANGCLTCVSLAALGRELQGASQVWS
ncbi:hypothetical protein V6N13_144034 [Hibiscus sabdariffa]|uniref:Thioredoxin domain-containing protein n=1 Tax=Hibiscus sabdariffa TaxID=183260 RepID=A0ABR2FJ71_9ROSI